MIKCFRKVYFGQNNIEAVAKMNVDATVDAACDAQWANMDDAALCKRGAMAGLSLGNLFRALRRLDTELKFDTPDQGTVTRTNDNHPAPQCRLDTYFAGALCEADHYSDVSDTDANVNVCTRAADQVLGIRPLCWYKPTASK